MFRTYNSMSNRPKILKMVNDRIIEAIPNRIAYLDALDLKIYPMN